MARKVVFRDHAEHLVSQTPGVLRQHLRMEMGYSHGGYTVTGWQLLSRMPVDLLGRGASSLLILEWEGKGWPVFSPP